jgi:hypothetical protein
MSQASTSQDREFWSFVNILLGPEPRDELVKYLGFSAQDLEKHFNSLKLKADEDSEQPAAATKPVPEPSSAASETADELFGGGDENSQPFESEFDFSATPTPLQAAAAAIENGDDRGPFALYSDQTTDTDALITNAVIATDFKLAIDICFKVIIRLFFLLDFFLFFLNHRIVCMFVCLFVCVRRRNMLRRWLLPTVEAQSFLQQPKRDSSRSLMPHTCA